MFILQGQTFFDTDDPPDPPDPPGIINLCQQHFLSIFEDSKGTGSDWVYNKYHPISVSVNKYLLPFVIDPRVWVKGNRNPEYIPPQLH